MHTGYQMAVYMGVRAVREFELLSHNLANASTVGFKRELLHLWRLPDQAAPLGARAGPAQFLDVRSRDYTQGPFHQTGSETDLALEGPGFFKVQTPRGVRYTRSGSFRLDRERTLVTPEGFPVLGRRGPIRAEATDQNFIVDPEGGVHLDQALTDQIAVVEFPNPQGLIPEGSTLFAATREAGEEQEAVDTRVRQGEIEESNLDPVAEMVRLINLQRSFEAYLKVLESFAASDQKVIEQVGQVA